MNIKAIGNVVVQTPYNLLDLKKDFPEVSFPAVLPDDMTSFHMHPLVEVPKPIGDYTMGIPKLIDKKWTQTWKAITYTEEEQTERTEQLFRRERDNLLDEADILVNQAFDTGINLPELQTYRQELRDSTTDWIIPTKPTEG